MQGMIEIPRLKPAAHDTWEIRTTFDADEIETARIPLEFPGPYMIVGAHVTVIQTTNAGSILVPTADDILCLIDVDNQRQYTAADLIGQTTGASRGEQFVTLSALDTEFRDLLMQLDSPRPVLGATFRWKVGADADGLYEDCLISLAFFCLPLKAMNGAVR